MNNNVNDNANKNINNNQKDNNDLLDSKRTVDIDVSSLKLDEPIKINVELDSKVNDAIEYLDSDILDENMNKKDSESVLNNDNDNNRLGENRDLNRNNNNVNEGLNNKGAFDDAALNDKENSEDKEDNDKENSEDKEDNDKENSEDKQDREKSESKKNQSTGEQNTQSTGEQNNQSQRRQNDRNKKEASPASEKPNKDRNVSSTKSNTEKTKKNETEKKKKEKKGKEKKKKKNSEKVQKRKEFIKKHFDIIIIAAICIIVLVIIILIIAAIAKGTNPSDSWTEYNYDNVKVEVDKKEVPINNYAMGAVYVKFYIEGKIDEYETDDAKINAMKAYALYAKSTALKDHFNTVKEKLTVDGVNKVGKTPTYCNYLTGCKEEKNKYVDGEYNEETHEYDSEYKGLFNESTDLKLSNKDDIQSVMASLYNIVITSDKHSDQLIQSNKQIDVTKLDDDLYSKIESKAKEGKNYETIIKEIEKENGRNAVLYNIQEYINKVTSVDGWSEFAEFNSDFEYVDQGFYWPIGSSSCHDENGITFCDGMPASLDITSHYTSYRELTDNPHYAIDIGAGAGTPVIASNDGVVIAVGCYPAGSCYLGYTYYYNPGECYVTIDHGNGIKTSYLHMIQTSFKVKAGQTVKRGQIIANVGSTGCSTGPHLHFAFKVNGFSPDPNPLKYVSKGNPRPIGKDLHNGGIENEIE